MLCQQWRPFSSCRDNIDTKSLRRSLRQKSMRYWRNTSYEVRARGNRRFCRTRRRGEIGGGTFRKFFLSNLMVAGACKKMLQARIKSDVCDGLRFLKAPIIRVSSLSFSFSLSLSFHSFSLFFSLEHSCVQTSSTYGRDEKARTST